jgi:hypothetical protein
MTNPKATDEVLGNMIQEIQTITQHVTDASNRVGEIMLTVREIQDSQRMFNARLEDVEGRCQGLSLKPTQRNCIHCGRIIRGVQNRCGVCGKDQ